MKGIFTRILEWPAWLIGAVIFAQALTVLVSLILNGHLIWSRLHPPTPAVGWSLDSTTYYKHLYQQGKLNYDLYLGQKAHSEQLAKLDKKRQARYRHIDTLSGAGLQHELDSLYHGGRQPGTTRPKTHAANRSGGASGTPGPGRPDYAPGRGGVPGHPVVPTAPGDPAAGPDDHAVKPAPAGQSEHRADRAEPSRVLPAEVARSQTGKLAVARGPGVVRSRETKTHLTYWRLIKGQGYQYPDVAWAISAVETGYWWSPAELAKHGHNLFGMKKSKRSFEVSVAKGGYCLYDCPASSLDDYGVYETDVIVRYGLKTRQAYIDHICQRFCPNPAYRGRLDLAFQTLRKVRALT